MMKYILSEMRQKHNKPIKILKNTMITGLTYSTNAIKIKKKETRNKETLNLKSLNINNNNNNINKYTSSFDIEVRKKILFTDSDYPLSVNSTLENFFFSKTQSFFLPSKENKNNNIIDYLNNNDAMYNLHNNYYYKIINDKFDYNENDKYKNLINILEEKIKNYNFSNEIILTKGFKLKKFDKENLYLSLKSMKIKIENKLYKDKIEFYLPFNIIPLFYALDLNKFILLLISSLEIKENKIIKLSNEKLKNYIIEIGKNIELFNENSSFYDKKSEEIKKINFLFNNNIYLFEIINPKIELKKLSGIKIIKNSGKGLLMYLIENDFFNWEKITLCYLSSLKNFRKEVNYIFQTKKNSNIINLDKYKFNPFFYRKINLETIYNKKEFSFLISLKKNNEEEIFLFSFHPYIIIIIYENIEKEFFLNFHEMEILFNLKEKGYKMENIIYKCLIINEKSKEIFFSIELLKDIDIEKFDNFFYQIKINKKSKLNIKINSPFFEYFCYENKENKFSLIKYNYIIEDSLLSLLIKNDFENWNNILNQFSENIFNNLNEVNGNKNHFSQKNLKSKKTFSKKKTLKHKYK